MNHPRVCVCVCLYVCLFVCLFVVQQFTFWARFFVRHSSIEFDEDEALRLFIRTIKEQMLTGGCHLRQDVG